MQIPLRLGPAAFLCATGLLLVPAPAQDTDIAYGRALAEDNCIRCHGIGEADESSHPEAPEFRTLSQRYPIEALAEAFVEGFVTGHPDMPEFTATPSQTAAIIAYLESVQK